MNSSPLSPVTKMAPHPRSSRPNYSSDPKTLPSYLPVPEAREYAFRPRIVYNDDANKTTEELIFQSCNFADLNMESHHIPIDGKGNKLWEYLRAVAKEDLKDIGEFLSFVDISYPELLLELQHWHTVLIQGYLHDKFFQKVHKQLKSFGQGYTLRNGILYFTMDDQVRLCIPDSADCNVHIKNGLLDKIYQSLGHISYNKTYYILASHFYWPNMAKDTFRILQDMWYLSVNQAVNLTPLWTAQASTNSGEAFHSHFDRFPICPSSYQQDYAGLV